jgi:uncharacterized protein YegP (UPF0339 family)
MSAYYELLRVEPSRFRFRLRAPDGEILLTGEPYNLKREAIAAIEACRISGPLERRYERTTTSAGEYGFVLRGRTSGILLGHSPAFDTEQERERALFAVKRHAGNLYIRDYATRP